MPLFGDRKPFPVAHSSGNENWGTFSPDGKWVAYSSDETGRAEIYAVSFLGPEGKWQISTKGGITSFWLPGNRLAYMWADGVTETEVTAQGDRLIVGKSRQILTGAAYGTSTGLYPDWQRKRWLIAQQVAEPNASPLILTTNWLSTLTH
jgi:hypothetical protein